ncbi:hypothetical protein [Chryseobacterium sp. ISL-6]|uniref:hypothetical protein n=1 Tax=Chryseobacterium sp. ISL-6 TaxID=2819143 RepID=UPI001BEA765A|nr:hypothetical protein [Chryseobacterium sp. ISL-6]MBT2621847.1 hypothetical protein [Chryseobacterium sp. ISL-6]
MKNINNISNIKKTLSIVALCMAGIAGAQVGVETETIRGSGILDFPTGINKGIILPVLTEANSTPSAGTIRMYNKVIQGVTSSGVVNFSDPGDTAAVTFNTSTPQAASVNSVIIGAATSAATGGALVLESDTKALILPHVSNVETMPSPYPGTICYDVRSKTFAMFDGKVWNFWK